VQGGRLLSVGTRAEVLAAHGGQAVDLKSRFVVPVRWSQHRHKPQTRQKIYFSCWIPTELDFLFFSSWIMMSEIILRLTVVFGR
jgi:hypothetical protein